MAVEGDRESLQIICEKPPQPLTADPDALVSPELEEDVLDIDTFEEEFYDVEVEGSISLSLDQAREVDDLLGYGEREKKKARNQGKRRKRH